MKKRPLALTVLACLHFLYPVYYTIQVLYFHHIPVKHLFPLLKILLNPFEQFTFFFLAISAIILGYGLLKVRAWAYWFFIFYASYTIGLNIYNYTKYAENDLIPPLIRFSTIIITFAIMFYLIRKHIRAPYFNPRLRWWENSPRFRVDDMQAKIKNLDEDNAQFETGEIYDLSINGVFIATKNPISLGKRVNVVFTLLGEITIDSIGKVVWLCPENIKTKHPQGFGLLFTDILKNDQRQIKSYLKSLSKELER